MKDRMFKTKQVNLEELSNFKFTIPTYQRPYVWEDEQLKKILDDFYIAYQANTAYYISTFLTKDKNNNAELIDGQQRFTTLWLIAFAINKLAPNSQIVAFLKRDEDLRLGFEIRKEISEFLENLLLEETASKKIYNLEYIEQHSYLRNIAKALVFINGYLEQLSIDKVKEFGDYIYTRVYLIKNTTPPKTDLNKLFSTINSSGVQLEQTDIVKANLLKLIDDKVTYSKIWETCENTQNFFERNARTSFSKSDWTNIDLRKYIAFNPSIFKYEAEDEGTNTEEFCLNTIDLESLPNYDIIEIKGLKEDRESEEVYVRSIISFGQLLIHTYRLHLHKENLPDFEGTFHVNRLIEIFSDLEKRNNAEEIKRFFRLLWKVRYLFDTYIIKWSSNVDTKNESLELLNFNRNEKSYYSRSKFEKSESLMLQSVLYFTGDYLRQYWLTTYLGYLLNHHNDLKATDDIHIKYLEKMDNIFSVVKNKTDKELSFSLLNNEEQDITFNIQTYLASNKGTSFKHYWFQKLEYILWKNWEDRSLNKFKNFKIASKNSVEHIYPQHPENEQTHPILEKEYLDNFGNLVLLSVSQNSEYSNKSVNIKKSMFEDKKDMYDSLKSHYIFRNSQWGKSEIKVHQKEMLKIILNHYSYEKQN